MLLRQELKLKAKKDLQGNVFIAFIALILPPLLASLPLYFIRLEESAPLQSIIGLINFLIYCAVLPMYTGAKKLFLNIANNKAPDFSNLIAPYRDRSFWEIIKANLLCNLFVLVGLVLLVVPGIYLALKYLMVNYILADKPELTYKEAMKMSAEIMIGNKLKALEILFSFILWFFLVIFTLGIGIIFVAPYFEATFTNFYNKIKFKESSEITSIIDEKDIYTDI